VSTLLLAYTLVSKTKQQNGNLTLSAAIRMQGGGGLAAGLVCLYNIFVMKIKIYILQILISLYVFL